MAPKLKAPLTLTAILSSAWGIFSLVDPATALQVAGYINVLADVSGSCQ